MKKFVITIETTAGFFHGFLAISTFCEAVLRYGFNKHIPDGFIIGQMMRSTVIYTVNLHSLRCSAQP